MLTVTVTVTIMAEIQSLLLSENLKEEKKIKTFFMTQ